MRAVVSSLCVALLGACHAPTDSNGAAGPPPDDVVSLLKSGDAKVCVDPLVQQTLERALVSSTIMGEALYNKMIAAGRHLTFDAVSMSSRNRDIGEVTCNATLISDSFKIPIDYTLRPTATGDKFTLSWTSDDPVEMVQGAIVSAVPLEDNATSVPTPQREPSGPANNSTSDLNAVGNVSDNSEAKPDASAGPDTNAD